MVLAPVCVLLLGFGQGGLFALALALVALRTLDAAQAAELSGMAQSIAGLRACAGGHVGAPS